MSDQKEYDNELQGFLGHENNSVVHRKGSITIKNEKKYFAIVESANDKGELKYELMMSVGLIHTNSEEEKRKPTLVVGKKRVNGDHTPVAVLELTNQLIKKKCRFSDNFVNARPLTYLKDALRSYLRG